MTDTTSTLLSVAPFLLVVGLWFFLLKRMRNGASSTQKLVIAPIQEMLQAVLIPEIRAMRESIDELRAEIKSLEERRG